MDLKLRNSSPSDLGAVMALERAGFAPGIVEDEAVFARRIAAFPEGFLVAGDPVWGYCCAEIWDGFTPEAGTSPGRFDLGHDIETWLRPDGDTLYLASMTVAPEARGTGKGRALFRGSLARLVDSFPAVRQAVLIVNQHWLGALSIYRQEGFVETGRLAGFFRPDDGPVGDAQVMVKALRAT